MLIRNRRKRIAIVRRFLHEIEKDCLERKVSLEIMQNADDMDICEDLQISVRALKRTKKSIEINLILYGIKENAE